MTSVQIEHCVGPGPGYTKGVQGLKTAVIGHSHYLEFGESDRASVTCEVLSRVKSGDQPLRFFTSVSRAFDGEPQCLFDKVLFFNFIPSAVEGMNSWGSEAQNKAALERLEKLLAQYQPDVAIAFSTKIWWALDKAGHSWTKLRDAGSRWIYETVIGGRALTVTRHPQGASKTFLKDVVVLAQARARAKLGK